MPILENDDMPDRAVLWRSNGFDGDGQPVYLTPEEIWLNYKLRRTESLDAEGYKTNLDAQCSVFGRIPLESKIWVAPSHLTSALTQWYASGSAGQTDEVMRVATQGETRDAKNIETRYTIGLQWFRDQPD